MPIEYTHAVKDHIRDRKSDKAAFPNNRVLVIERCNVAKEYAPLDAIASPHARCNRDTSD